jgi:hypothetical protein
MRRVTKLLLIQLLMSASVDVTALEVRQFDMTRDRLEVRHYLGGKYPDWVKAETGADFVMVAGFYGEKTVAGRKLRCGVDLTIENRAIKIGPHWNNRKVLASYSNGRVAIYPNAASCLAAGLPDWALAGATIPPNPNQKLWRQFWAIKGKYYYWVKMRGNRRDCLKLAKQWGFESIVHMDGGSSLAGRVLHPSYVVVLRSALSKKPIS